jgi:nitroimidazol reductase NimA-like FMN-containing flavoprotein (pyridoxamine 5'-phosphate oxidase superfamily)
MPMTNEDLQKFLSETQVAVISTVDADNHPRSAPIWYEWEDGAAYLFTGRGTLKWRNIERNPHVSPVPRLAGGPVQVSHHRGRS